MITDWAISTLKEHVDERFSASKEAVAQALVSQKELYQTVQSAADKAITKAEDAQKQYNLSHNDLLKKMEDMLPRKEADAREKNYEERLEAQRKEIVQLNSRLDVIAGKGSGTQQIIVWVFLAIAILGFIITNLKLK
jgi:hypothetical protein